MRSMGLLLICAGCLAASWVASQHATEVRWSWFVPALLLGVVGVAVARAGARQAAQDTDKVFGDLGALESSLQAIVTKIDAFDAQKTTLNPYDAHGRIDELFPDDINTFVEARETIGQVYGLDAYAAVMNEFAAGERYLARVWSASVDGYIDEVNTYIGRAREQFHAAQRLFSQLKA